MLKDLDRQILTEQIWTQVIKKKCSYKKNKITNHKITKLAEMGENEQITQTNLQITQKNPQITQKTCILYKLVPFFIIYVKRNVSKEPHILKTTF